MNKKRSILIGILVIFGVGAVIWALFLAGQRKMEISQEDRSPVENKEELVIEAPEEVAEAGEAEKSAGDGQETKKTTDQIVGEFKEQQKKPTETTIKPEEIIKKPIEQEKSSLNVVDRLASFGFQKYSGERNIDTIVLHSSFNSLGGDQYDVEKIVDIYRQYGVSAHYIVGRDGTAYRLVDENNISYHAGVSQVPDGRTNVNNFSIGIEMVGNYEDGYTEEQYEAINALVEDIKSRYEIKYVLGHDDIAPERKTDPWGFQWDRIEK